MIIQLNIKYNSDKELRCKDVQKSFCDNMNSLYFRYANVKDVNDTLKDNIVKIGSAFIIFLFEEGETLKKCY